MTDINLLKKGDIISFDMIRPGLFGAQYKAAVIQGIVDFNTARLVDPDVLAHHAAFFPYFKDTVPIDDPAIYNYMVLQLDPTSSKLIVIGFPWINKDSLTTLTSRYATVIIQNFQEYQKGPLQDFLANLNVTYTLKIEDS